MLKDNYSFADSLGTWGNYKFYEYYRSCTGCSTIISLATAVNREYSVFINFDTTEKVAFHQKQNSSDFQLNGREDRDIVITPEDLISKGHSDKKGYFLIEVHSHSDLNYTISATSNQKQIKSLSRGQPKNFNISDAEAGEYFVYRHDSSKSFVIEVQEQYGFIQTLVNAVPEGEALEDHLPSDQSHAQWSSYQTNDRNVIEVNSESDKFCKKCNYVIKVESNSNSKGTITVQEKGKQTTTSKTTLIKAGNPQLVSMQAATFRHFKFIIPDNDPFEIKVQTLAGEVEYIIASDKISDDSFDSEANKKIIFKGSSSTDYISLKVGENGIQNKKMYYLTIRSNLLLSRLVISVGHAGHYSLISEATPQSVKLSKESSLFYYVVDRSTPRSNVLIETFLEEYSAQNFSVYVKLVDKEDNLNSHNDEGEDKPPAWQLSPEEIVNTHDHILRHQQDKEGKMYMNFEISTQDAERKVILIAVKGDSEDSNGSKIKLYISQSSISPLEFGKSHYGYIENKQDMYKIYEAYIPHLSNETYVVEVTPCYGKAEVLTARNFNNIIDDNFISSTNHMSNGRLYINVENRHRKIRKFLIAVRSINNSTKEYKDYEFTEFQIEINKFPQHVSKNAIPEKYHIPNEGELEWRFNDDGFLEISWPKIYDAAGSQELLEEQIAYFVYVGTKDKAGLESPCSIENTFEAINTEPIYGNSYVLKLDSAMYSDVENLYINVVGHVYQKSSSEGKWYSQYPIAYHPLQLPAEVIEEDDSWIDDYFWPIAIITIIVLLIALACIWRRYKRVSKKLNENVREVRHADFGQEMRSTKVYNQFADQNQSHNE